MRPEEHTYLPPGNGLKQQDVEQLRIRMEAFSELLRQRNYQRKVAV